MLFSVPSLTPFGNACGTSGMVEIGRANLAIALRFAVSRECRPRLHGFLSTVCRVRRRGVSARQ
jgi:hypothetical protein